VDTTSLQFVFGDLGSIAFWLLLTYPGTVTLFCFCEKSRIRFR
jgi:hypothetical protein